MKSAAFQRSCERLALLAMLCGVFLVLQPWWRLGFRLGFALTGAGVLLEIVAGHLPGGVALGPAARIDASGGGRDTGTRDTGERAT